MVAALRALRRPTNLAVDAAHAEAFDLEGLLDAAVRAPVDHQLGRCRSPSCRRRARSRQRAFGRDDAFVDADDAVFEASATRQMRPMSRL